MEKRNLIPISHFILVGFGDAGMKIFPSLMQIFRDNIGNIPLEISIVDRKPIKEVLKDAKPKLKKLFEKYSEIPYDENFYLEFLDDNYFQNYIEDKLIPERLVERIEPERTIIYLAINPDLYLKALNKYLKFGNIFAIEKPLAKNLMTANKLLKFTKENARFFNKHFIPVDHYLGKTAFSLLNSISNNKRLGDIIEDANLISFSFLETAEPSIESTFPSTGIIADMMPHVLALLKKILKTEFTVEPVQVESSFLDKYVDQCKEKKISLYRETYAEIKLILSEDGKPTRTIIIRVGKGMCDEERTIVFEDSTRSMLCIELNKSDVSLISGKLKDEIVIKKKTPRSWDISWYSIIKDLIKNDFDQFITMENAHEIVKTIEKIRSKNNDRIAH
jgi:hypothetical protein